MALRLIVACVLAAVPLGVGPAAAKVCIDQGTITAMQVSGSGPDAQWLQLTLDGRANYVAATATLPAVFSGYASLASGAYFAARPIRVGYEQGPTANMIQFIDAPAQASVPSTPGCPARGGPSVKR